MMNPSRTISKLLLSNPVVVSIDPRAETPRFGGGDQLVTPVAVKMGVLLPVYNESKLIGRTFEAVLAFARTHPDYRFIFVDDGSTDQTVKRIEERLAQARCPRISLLALPVNGGKGRAIHTAMLACESPMICFTDGDLAYSLDHLPLLAAALERADVVIGSRNLVHRAQKNTRILRKILGWGFNKLTRLVLGLAYDDMQAGLKAFRHEAAQRIFTRQRVFDFSFDAEIVFLASRLGYRIAEIPAYVSEEHSYKISKVSLLRDPLRMFVALWRIRLNSLRGRYA